VRYGLGLRVIRRRPARLTRLTIIESERYGQGLLLGRLLMTAERQRSGTTRAPRAFSALLRRRASQRVLGGSRWPATAAPAREWLRHPACSSSSLVEIEAKVVALEQEHLPSLGAACWAIPVCR